MKSKEEKARDVYNFLETVFKNPIKSLGIVAIMIALDYTIKTVGKSPAKDKKLEIRKVVECKQRIIEDKKTKREVM